MIVRTGEQLPPHVFVLAASHDLRKLFFCSARTLNVYVPAQTLEPAEPGDITTSTACHATVTAER